MSIGRIRYPPTSGQPRPASLPGSTINLALSIIFVASVFAVAMVFSVAFYMATIARSERTLIEASLNRSQIAVDVIELYNSAAASSRVQQRPRSDIKQLGKALEKVLETTCTNGGLQKIVLVSSNGQEVKSVEPKAEEVDDLEYPCRDWFEPVALEYMNFISDPENEPISLSKFAKQWGKTPISISDIFERGYLKGTIGALGRLVDPVPIEAVLGNSDNQSDFGRSTVVVVFDPEKLHKEHLKRITIYFFIAMTISASLGFLNYIFLRLFVLNPVSRISTHLEQYAKSSKPDKGRNCPTPDDSPDKERSEEVPREVQFIKVSSRIKEIRHIEDGIRELEGSERALTALGKGVAAISHTIKDLCGDPDAVVRTYVDKLLEMTNTGAFSVNLERIEIGNLSGQIRSYAVDFRRSNARRFDIESDDGLDWAEFKLSGDEGNTLIAERRLLLSTVGNLIDNSYRALARDTARKEKWVWVDFVAEGDFTAIYVEDNGPGFGDCLTEGETMEGYIRRIKKSTDSSTGNFGLGLWSAVHFVETQGGSLELCEPRKEGNKTGACFRIALPTE